MRRARRRRSRSPTRSRVSICLGRIADQTGGDVCGPAHGAGANGLQAASELRVSGEWRTTSVVACVSAQTHVFVPRTVCSHEPNDTDFLRQTRRSEDTAVDRGHPDTPRDTRLDRAVRAAMGHALPSHASSARPGNGGEPVVAAQETQRGALAAAREHAERRLLDLDLGAGDPWRRSLRATPAIRRRVARHHGTQECRLRVVPNQSLQRRTPVRAVA